MRRGSDKKALTPVDASDVSRCLELAEDIENTIRMLCKTFFYRGFDDGEVLEKFTKIVGYEIY